MTCPQCGVDHNCVKDSRESRDGLAQLRRRVCLECGHSGWTRETWEDAKPLVRRVRTWPSKEGESRKKKRQHAAK